MCLLTCMWTWLTLKTGARLLPAPGLGHAPRQLSRESPDPRPAEFPPELRGPPTTRAPQDLSTPALCLSSCRLPSKAGPTSVRFPPPPLTWVSVLFGWVMPQFSSVQFSRSVVSDSLWPHESQHTRPPCPSPTPGVHSDSRPSSQWRHPAISSSVVLFSCPQSLPASETYPVSQLFTWGGQSTGVSALASFLPMNTQDWSPSKWTGWISLQSKGLERIFSNTTVQKHQFFGAQPSSQSNSHIHTPQEKP